MTTEHNRVWGRWGDVVLLLLFSGWFAAVHLGAPLADPDEPRSAIISRLMAEGGDWLSPHLPATFHHAYHQGPLEGDLFAYWDKPPVFFWLAALAMKVMEPSALAVRLPAAAGFVATVLLVYAGARHSWGRSAGLVAGLVLAVSPLAVGLAHVARMETLLMAFMTAMLLAALRLLSDRPKSGVWTGVFYISAALGILTKGLVAVVLPALAILATLALLRRWKDILHLRPFSGIAIILAIAAPWFVYMHLRYPPGTDCAGFTRAFFIDQHLMRATAGTLGHKHFPGYVLGGLLAGCFPWTFFLPGTFVWGWHEFRNRREAQVVLLLPVFWAAVVTVLFSLSSTQQVYYGLPAIPALAILVGGYLNAHTHGLEKTRLFMATAWITLIAMAPAIIAILIFLAYRDMWKAGYLAFLLPMAAILLAGAAALRKGLHSPGLGATAGTAALMITFALAAAPIGVYQDRTTQAEARLVLEAFWPGDGVIAYPYTPFSFWWYMWPHPVTNPIQTGIGKDTPPLDRLVSEVEAYGKAFVLLPGAEYLDILRRKFDRPVKVLSSRRKHTLVLFCRKPQAP
jgi:4-amino-4-deoxy-L-arabinose transferase-like glycosyltransferase